MPELVEQYAGYEPDMIIVSPRAGNVVKSAVTYGLVVGQFRRLGFQGGSRIADAGSYGSVGYPRRWPVLIVSVHVPSRSPGEPQSCRRRAGGGGSRLLAHLHAFI